MKNATYSLVFVCAASLSAACAPIVADRGHIGIDRSLHEVEVGKSNINDVFTILGSPSAKASFGEPIWYYIYTVNETKAFLHPEVTKEQVTAIHFNDSDIVANIERYSLENGRKIAFADEITPTEGKDMGVVGQLIGNIGRFNGGPQQDSAE